ncbi:MAG TPA: hypothetical protein VMI72_05135 [Roseiarcus sp.]|nr:hypothetical protein [Roseiarcus sp.]
MGEAAKAKRQAPQREIDRNLEVGARKLVGQLVDAARQYLQSKLAKQTSEEGLNELEYALRQLRPLFDALAKSMQDQESLKHKFGFLFRFVEAILNISVYTGSDTLIKVLKSGSKKGGDKAAQINSANAEARWRRSTRAIAKKIWQEGAVSQDRLAEKILLTGMPSLPEHRQVKRLISEMQQNGELPRKKLRT